MTFNIIKQGNKEQNASPSVVLKSDTEVSNEIYLKLESFNLNKVFDAVKSIVDTSNKSLEDLIWEIDKEESAAVLYHSLNVFSLVLYDKMTWDMHNSVNKHKYEHFKINEKQNLYSSINSEYEYDEDDYDYEEEVLSDEQIKEQIIKKRLIVDSIKKKKEVDFAYEINAVKEENSKELKKYDLKEIVDIIEKSLIKNKNNGRIMMGDKNALMQAAISLQKCAILKNSLEDFIYIKDKLKPFVPMLVNNMTLQKQIFTNNYGIFPQEYSLLLEGENKVFMKFSTKFDGTRHLNSLISKSTGQEQVEGLDIKNVRYEIFRDDFESLLMINNYLSLNEGIEVNVQNRNSVVMSDLQNIKNFISETSKFQKSIDFENINESNSMELFLITNIQMKKMILEGKDVKHKNFDLAFINNCSKIIANSMSASLYDFVFHDEIFSQIIDKEKLLKHIVERTLCSFIYSDIEERNQDTDLPKEVLINIIDLFSNHITFEQIENSFKDAVKDVEQKDIDESKKTKKSDYYSPRCNELSKDLVVELLSGYIRNEKIQSGMDYTNKTPHVSKRKKI